MATITRRRSSRDPEAEVKEEERSENENEGRETSPRRSPSSRRREEKTDDRPTRSRGSRRSSDDKGSSEDQARPSRRSRKEKAEGSPRRRGTGGFSSYEQKKRSNSKFADEFKPPDNTKTLMKVLDEEPFDVFNQHWVDDLPKGSRLSYVCRDDEYFNDEDGCPICDIGESASTMSLFNVLNLINPRKPEVQVWRTTPSVTDKLKRASLDSKTSPLNREDLYFEVERIKGKNKTEWAIQPVKSRDLEEDFDIEPFGADELDDFAQNLFTDRTAVTQVDSYDDLLELAESLD